MMTEFSRKKSGKVQLITFLIGLVATLTMGICMLSQGNTIYAQETNTDEQTEPHTAALTIENQSQDQTSPTVHIIAFGLVITVSAATAGILIAVYKCNKRKKQFYF